MARIVYVAGAFRPEGEATVSVFDHGLLYGDGVFEGIRAYDGRVFKLDRHLDRLSDSASAIRLTLPCSRQTLADLVLETCRRNEIIDGYIRLVVTRGAGDLGIDPRSCPRPEIVIIARPGVSMYRRGPGGGVTLATSSLRRTAPDALSPSVKSLNYLNSVLARIDAHDRGADEALILDHNGLVAEAAADNIFIVSDGILLTPPTLAALKGITRETILELARDLGLHAEVRPLTLTDVWTAREVFICGTGAEVVPVVTVDGRTIGDGQSGPMTERLIAAYDYLVRSTGTPIYSSPDTPAFAGFRV